jgi:hypothetical protein
MFEEIINPHLNRYRKQSAVQIIVKQKVRRHFLHYVDAQSHPGSRYQLIISGKNFLYLIQSNGTRSYRIIRSWICNC